MDRRKMVATVATITSDAEAAIILNGSDFNVSGLFINRLIIFTSGSELLSSDGSGNNCRLVMQECPIRFSKSHLKQSSYVFPCYYCPWL